MRRAAKRKHSKRDRSCPTGKRRFRSKDEALALIHRATHHGDKKKPCRCYPCDRCKGWHLSSQPGAKGEDRG